MLSNIGLPGLLLIAGVVMTALALLGWVGAAIAGLVLIALALGALARALRAQPAA